MTIRLTFFLTRRKKVFEQFAYWQSWGFKFLCFEANIFRKRYRYVSPWQEHIIDYLRAEDEYRL